MTTLYHEIALMTSTDRVWALLTTRTGLNRWAPGEISIHGGDSWRFVHEDDDREQVFRVVEEEPHKYLEWLCLQGHEDWQNTLIHWRVEAREAGLHLILEHRDLRKTAAEMASLNTQWGVWLSRLAQQLQHDLETIDDEDLNAWT